jgi:hypothetical protein
VRSSSSGRGGFAAGTATRRDIAFAIAPSTAPARAQTP